MTSFIETRAVDQTQPIGGYIPKPVYAYIALALFAIVSVVFWTRLFMRRPRYMVWLCAGSTAMTVGFALRVVLHGSPYSLGIYIVEDLCILLSPCFFLATNYIILSRLAVSLSTESAPISTTCLLLPAQRIAKIFVWSDVITFWIQASGGGLSAQQSLAAVGQDIALVGLVLQLLSYALYTVLLLVFGTRVRSRYPEVWHMGKQDGRKEWRVLYYTTCLTCIGILIRSAFRIAEFSEGYNGWIPTHEAYFYCLDSIPLLLAISLYMFVWPPIYTHQGQTKGDIPMGSVDSVYAMGGAGKTVV
ncbi:RTA1-domain-containing protein [Athelia psychrophila]|uniref:RTA1-domain-containing protein n=1 Tax=Athelia psychrophila TaxID=1759441 RepID=A0A167V8W5_9AGAM|nr:RTA1-domain-containing protein [Fibularhizoctonia sp. CBS 109695]